MGIQLERFYMHIFHRQAVSRPRDLIRQPDVAAFFHRDSLVFREVNFHTFYLTILDDRLAVYMMALAWTLPTAVSCIGAL